MNCQEFWSTLPQRGGEITGEQAGHLAACSVCASHWGQHRALAAGFESLREDWRQMEAPERVEAGLAAAFRLQMGAQVRRTSTAPSRWRPVLVWVSAAAATIALATVLIHGSNPSPARPDTVAAPRHSAQPASELAEAQDVDADDEASILGDGFVRLPNAQRLGPNEPFDVVQLSFPGSEMIALGLPVSEDRAGETILADVALAQDGTARAVRLISDGGTF